MLGADVFIRTMLLLCGPAFSASAAEKDSSMLSTYKALSFTVKVKEIAKIFCKIPDCVYGQLNAEMSGIWIRYWDL
jgi:hypothetical protein